MKYYAVTVHIAVAESKTEPLRPFGSMSALLSNLSGAAAQTEGVFLGGITMEEQIGDDLEDTGLPRHIPLPPGVMMDGEGVLRRMVPTPSGPIPAPTMEELEVGAVASTGKTAEEREREAPPLRLMPDPGAPTELQIGGHP
jgi:hypothetical protein